MKNFNTIDLKTYPFLKNPFAQTIAAELFWQSTDRKPDLTHRIPLSDGDRLLIMEYKNSNWKPGDRIAILAHGLAGDFQSHYLVRLTRKLNKMGLNVFRINFRACGPGLELAKNLPHAGRSQDMQEVLAYVHKLYPNSPITMMGFSLSANILLKMLGEYEPYYLPGLDSAVCVSPPANLTKTSDYIQQNAKLFDQYFVYKLKKFTRMRHQAHNLTNEIPEFSTVQEYDDVYLAPMCGFKSGQDYYRQSSAEPLLLANHYPTLVIHAMDDPVVEPSFLDIIKAKNQYDLAVTDKGGHLGFLQNSLINVHWMDETIIRWLRFNTKKSDNLKSIS